MKSRRILVIDPRTDQLVRNEQLLLDDGWLVLASAKPEATLLLSRTFRPDTILLSADLPGGTAFELAMQLRLDDRTRDVPLAMCSAQPESVVVKALDSGAELVLPVVLDPLARERLRGPFPTALRSSALRLFRFVRDCGLDGVVTVSTRAGSGWASFSDGALVDASFAGFSGADAVVAMISARVLALDFCSSEELIEEVDAELELVAERPEHPWDLAA